MKKTLAVTTAALTLLLGAAGCAKTDDNAAGSGDKPAAASPSPTGNGIADLTADQILAKAKAALKDAKSYRVKGSATQDGQKMTIDLEQAGADSAGAITIGEAKVELLKVGTGQFMRPNEAFWKTSGVPASQLKTITGKVGTRWVKVPADNKDLGSLFDSFNPDEELTPDGTASKGGTKVVDGKPAIALIDSTDKDSSLWIATEGEPYPLEVSSTKDGSNLTFSDFGTTFDDIKTPAASDTLDLSALQG